MRVRAVARRAEREAGHREARMPRRKQSNPQPVKRESEPSSCGGLRRFKSVLTRLFIYLFILNLTCLKGLPEVTEASLCVFVCGKDTLKLCKLSRTQRCLTGQTY